MTFKSWSSMRFQEFGNVTDKPLPAPKDLPDCPFSEKDECKALGGKWDNEKGKCMCLVG